MKLVCIFANFDFHHFNFEYGSSYLRIYKLKRSDIGLDPQKTRYFWNSKKALLSKERSYNGMVFFEREDGIYHGILLIRITKFLPKYVSSSQFTFLSAHKRCTQIQRFLVIKRGHKPNAENQRRFVEIQWFASYWSWLWPHFQNLDHIV